MLTPQDFILGRTRSVIYALRGFWLIVSTQHSIWVQSVFSLVVVGLSFWLQLERWEWCAVLLAIGMVLTAESLNTAVEFVADALTLNYDPRIAKAKDAGAGAVLMAVIFAFLVGLVVFGPRVLEMVK